MPSRTTTLYFPELSVLEYNSANPKPYQRSIGANSAVQRTRSRTWSNTSGFKTKRRNREEFPNNPYEDSIFEREMKASWHSHTNWYSGKAGQMLTEYDYAGGISPPVVTLPLPVHTQLYNKALSKIPARINGAQFSSPIFLAEFAKTSKMITSFAKEIAIAIPKTSQEKRAWKRRKEWQNAWLEYRYGWRLLLKDIYDAMCALHDLRIKRPVLRVAAESTQQTTEVIVTTASAVTDSIRANSLFWADCKTTRVTTSTTRLSVRFRETSPVLGSLQQFGITNPLSVAWELVPYSFVVDWLLPVGDYLRSFDTWVGKEFVSGCVGYVHEVQNHSVPTSFYCSQPSQWWWVTSQVQPGFMKSKRRQYKRIPLASFPSATLPRIEVNLNAARTADAIALLKQQFDRSLGKRR